jgi:biotin carboxyl carrier protein
VGHAYTPGLKVSAAAEMRRTRLLPIAGELLVAVGQRVQPDTVVARALLPGNVVTLPLSRQLGVAPADLHDLLLVREGGAVSKGQPVARSKGLFGLMKQTVESPASGTLESVSKVSGQALFREAPQPVEVKAYLAGTVAAVDPPFGCDITARGTIVQGIFGIGPETSGPIAVLHEDPARPLAPADIRPEHQGAVLVGGSLARLDVLRRAIEVKAAALVTGGLDAADLKQLLGYDLGVAITGNETIGLTLVVTEGFGELAMSARTLRLLSAAAGRTASVSGATQIRAGVLRPEVLVPGDVAEVERTAVDSGLLLAGSTVRIIRDPHFGALGRVVELPPEPRLLDTEAKVRILTVALAGGQRVTLPRANVELVDERA